MTKLLAAAALVLLCWAPPADAADPPEPVGPGCAFAAVDDPTAPHAVAVVGGGPVTTRRRTQAGPSTSRCGARSAPAATRGTTSRPRPRGGPGAAALAPTVVLLPDDEGTVLCGEVTLTEPDGRTRTFHHDHLTGGWSTDPAAACNYGERLLEPHICPAGTRSHLIDECSPLGPAGLDGLICPPLALLFPPQGDVQGIWDCPPYGARDRY